MVDVTEYWKAGAAALVFTSEHVKKPYFFHLKKHLDALAPRDDRYHGVLAHLTQAEYEDAKFLRESVLQPAAHSRGWDPETTELEDYVPLRPQFVNAVCEALGAPRWRLTWRYSNSAFAKGFSTIYVAGVPVRHKEEGGLILCAPSHLDGEHLAAKAAQRQPSAAA